MYTPNVSEIKFPRHGEITFDTQHIEWKEQDGGEILFRLKGKNSFLRIPKIVEQLTAMPNASQDRDRTELVLVNQLLAYYRPHAMPDLNGYYAASAGISDSGRLYIRVNNELHNKHSFAGRGCAETSMLRTYQEDRSKPNAQFSKVYLMSGVMKRQQGVLKDIKPGHVSCLCGECRQNLRSHTESARFIMVPSNDGTKTPSLNATATRHNELGEFEAWVIPHNLMYPLPEFKELSVDKSPMIFEGYDYIIDTESQSAPIKTELPELPKEGNTISLSLEQYTRLKKAYEQADFTVHGLNDNPTLANINQTMLQLIKKAYAAHKSKQPVQNIEITVILVKNTKGEFYPGIVVNGDLWLPSKPPEIPSALSNAFNTVGVAEVYMMTFDEHQIQHEKAIFDMDGEVTHGLKMPDPAGLGRLIKNMKSTDHSQMHVVALNNGSLGEDELKSITDTFSIRESFGPDFSNPKKTKPLGFV